MTMYRHQSTGAIAELIEDKGVTVQLKVAETSEVKEVGAATFKRWWKLVENEVEAVEPDQIKANESEVSPDEPTANQNELETPEAEETTIEESDAPTDVQDAPVNEYPEEAFEG